MPEISIIIPCPEISIIIPCYKVEKYLRRCLDSVLAQTFQDWEAICVDDGSPDEYGNILDEYASRDGRIKVIHQENQGLSMARNNGKKLAMGDYIYFLDSDDAMHPQLLEVAYGLAQKHNADLVNFECYNSDKEEFKNKNIDVNKVKTKVTNNPMFSENISLKEYLFHLKKVMKRIKYVLWQTPMQSLFTCFIKPISIRTKGLKQVEISLFPYLAKQYFTAILNISSTCYYKFVIGHK